MHIEFNRMSIDTNPMGPGAGFGYPDPFGGDSSMAASRCCGCDPSMSAGGPMGFGGPMGAGGGFPMSPGLANTQFLMQMVQMLSTMLMGNTMQQALGGSGGGGGSPSVDGASGGGGSNSGGTSAVDGSGGSSAIGGTTGSGGSAAVDLGRKFLGKNAIDIKGQLPHFTAAGGQTNNCADFVSSCLESTGGLKGHFVNVRGLEDALKKQGYREVPQSQAKPGDVWISNSRGHTEMVTTAGGGKTIGANNDRPGHQVISERAKAPGTGVFYSKG